MVETETIPEVDLVRRITIEKVRWRPSDFKVKGCPMLPIDPEHIEYAGSHAKITFNHPMEDFKGNSNEHLDLILNYFGGGQDMYWAIHINDSRGYSLVSAPPFGMLNGDIGDYSERKLKGWQQSGELRFEEELKKLEDLYLKGEVLPEDFFELNGHIIDRLR